MGCKGGVDDKMGSSMHRLTVFSLSVTNHQGNAANLIEVNTNSSLIGAWLVLVQPKLV